MPFPGSWLDLGLRLVWQPAHDAAADLAEPGEWSAVQGPRGQTGRGRGGSPGWRREPRFRDPSPDAEGGHHAAHGWPAPGGASGTIELEQGRGRSASDGHAIGVSVCLGRQRGTRPA